MQAPILSNYRVSVIIPHLNEPDDLRRCLAALEMQKDDRILFEVIVVDNGSYAMPGDVCSGVRLEQELDPGPGPARNRGASLAQADILAFIDADCIADTGWIRRIVEFFDGHPDVACIAGDIRVSPGGPSHTRETEAYERIFSYRVQLYVERDHFAATGNMAVRRHIFQAVGPFGGITTREDNDWGRRATAQGFRIAYVPQVRVFTPPCKNFAELKGRWNRLIANEFKEFGSSPRQIARWIVRSIAIACSPLIDIPKIVLSDRVASFTERRLAAACLTRIRIYRSYRMLKLALTRNTDQMAESWNRS
jgi:glycosyltransferase involved in cell wall biosynthesis